MNTLGATIEFEDDLILAACEFRWSNDDKFALIEAIAICAANDLQYPKWVRAQINNAMTGIFEAVFPDEYLTGGRSGLGISHLPEGHEITEMRERFKATANVASRQLSLKLDRRNIIDTHIKAVRDYCLAELVGRFVDFDYRPTPRFSQSKSVTDELTDALNLSKSDWEERQNAKELIGPINGHTVLISTVEPICRMATFDVIDDAWDANKEFFLADRDANKEFFLADRIAKFEDDHGTHLGV